jgi:hypothetical protein
MTWESSKMKVTRPRENCIFYEQSGRSVSGVLNDLKLVIFDRRG